MTWARRGVGRSNLLAILVVLAGVLVFADVSRSGAGRSGPGSASGSRRRQPPPGRARPPGFAVSSSVEPEVGEMPARLAEALNAFGAGRYDECRKLAEDLISGTTDSSTRAECVGMVILSHLHEGDFDAAREAAARFRSVSPDVCQDLLAEVKGEEAGYQAEVSRLQQIVATTNDPGRAARAQFRTARVHHVFGRLKLAGDSYAKILSQWPEDGNAGRALAGLATVLAIEGEPGEAVSSCEHALGDHPGNVGLARSGAYAVLYLVLAGQGETAAQECFRRLIASHAGTEAAAHAQLVLGGIYKREGKQGLAEQALIATARGYPSSPAAQEARAQLTAMYDATARACEGKDDWEGEIVAWTKALDFDRDDSHRAETMLRIADALINQGRGEDALPYLGQLEGDARPGFRRWKDQAEWLEAAVYHQTGNREKTAAILRRIASSPDHSQRKAAQEFLERLAEQD